MNTRCGPRRANNLVLSAACPPDSSLRRLILPLVMCILVCAPPVCQSADAVFIESDDFTVSSDDLRLYLNASEDVQGRVEWGSKERVYQAIMELYVLKTLAREGEKQGLISEERKAWIAYYQAALAHVRLIVEKEAAEAVADTDWSLEAKEYYLANRAEFVRAEAVVVRALLLDTNERSITEAIDLASGFIERNLSQEEFAAVVTEYTDDAVTGGEELTVRRGETVPVFEEAAFGLTEVGEISSPIVSRYGVHLIQLLGRIPEQQMSFESVENKIIPVLREKREAEARQLVKMRPHVNPPADVVMHQEAIDRFLEMVTEQYQEAQIAPPRP